MPSTSTQPGTPKPDRQQVSEWFSAFEKSGTRVEKEQLVTRICEELNVPTTLGRNS